MSGEDINSIKSRRPIREANPIQALPVNRRGTDYFVGDIHGAFDKLQTALEKLGFRSDRDRLISVGDLVDRGNHSHLSEMWLSMPYFHAVRGNHENLYLKWRALGDEDRGAQILFEDEVYFPNGGSWVENISEEEHCHIEQALKSTPYIITVPAATGETVAVVHAQLPDGSSWPQIINNEFDNNMIEELTWSRNRMMNHRNDRRAKPVNDGNKIPGLAAVVCGHYVTNMPTWVGQFYFIETAGWSDGRSFIIPSLDQIVKASKLLP